MRSQAHRLQQLVRAAGLCMLLCTPLAAWSQSMEFSFGVIGHVVQSPGDDSALEQAIAASDADNLAFVVANGFKRGDEACTDQLYQRRLDLLNAAKNGLVLTLADADWAGCKNAGHLNSAERLSRVRELFFVDDFSFGASKIPLMRQSNIPKFRSYVENARWEIGNVLFASVNLPANNNHYRAEAGRNSEFEDRLIANRDWLRRSFMIATRKKMAAITLFCDGNPLQKFNPRNAVDASGRRDGFAETRQQIIALAGKFPGKVLIVHNRADTHGGYAGIVWHGNLGDLDVGPDWVKLSVRPGSTENITAAKGNNE